MHAQKQESPPDPIRSLVLAMRDDEVMRVYRQLEGRIERLVEWTADIARREPQAFADHTDLVRETFGVGKYVVRVLTKHKNGKLLIRISKVVSVTRWEAAVTP